MALADVVNVLFVALQDDDGNPLETEYGLSTYRDHQTFSIQVIPFCMIPLFVSMIPLFVSIQVIPLCMIPLSVSIQVIPLCMIPLSVSIYISTYIVPLQGNYSETLPAQARPKKRVLRSIQVIPLHDV